MTMLRVLPQRKGIYKWKLLWNLVFKLKIYFNYYFWKLPYHSDWVTAASRLNRVLLFRGPLYLPTNTTWPFNLGQRGGPSHQWLQKTWVRQHHMWKRSCLSGYNMECENKKGHGRWLWEGDNWGRSWGSHTSRQQEEEVRQTWSKGALMVEQEWINVLWRADTGSTVQ